MRHALVIFCSICFLAVLASSAAVKLHIDGERVWLEANRAPLRDVLKAFAHYGVNVQVDPDIGETVSLRISNAPLEPSLREMLDRYAYVLTWDVVPGPLGEILRLSDMSVFRPGSRERARPLEEDTRLRVARGPDGRGPEFVQDELLIGFSADVSLDQIRLLLREIGGVIVEGYPELGIYRVRLPPGTHVLALREQLARHPAVAEIEPNYVFREPAPHPVTSDGASASQTRTRLPPAGSAPVAVMDSGLLDVEGLDGLVAGGLDALMPTQALSDPSGHGTQMALITSGVVAPTGQASDDERAGVPILAVRTFDDEGMTTSFGLMRSLQFAVEQGARVVNMSWGSGVDSQFIASAVAHAQSKGMVMVAAAGNEPLGQPVYPAAYPGVVAVGAIQQDGTPWPSSNFGDFITVSAPGAASLPIGHNGPAGAYAGTSISSAYVSYALGLYMQRHPSATPTQAVRALQTAVSTENETKRNDRTGYGVLDSAAIERLLQTKP